MIKPRALANPDVSLDAIAAAIISMVEDPGSAHKLDGSTLRAIGKGKGADDGDVVYGGYSFFVEHDAAGLEADRELPS